ncbi:ligand-binding sensor domain-containing protein [Microscilla marina]|uniref:Ggdef domain protein, putative n=1 Tax=Microscilla marina ATCC 23134 TaxID=313606 RepID=A1ZV20_MICM2|nr:two-component regulator propeller domain-containing protein [Microscilla marina]EAY25798.1 ggdef domain protein, putative [Microscilla marina ATCC 23134]
MYGQSALQQMKFARLTPKDGLSQNTINCVLQDKRGVLWFGTADGLSKYEGYQLRTYKTELGNQNSLSNNYVLCLYEDSAGYIWIGTYGGGLNKFDPNTEEFTRYQHRKADSTSITSNDVRSIYEDDQGVFWISMYRGGVDMFDPKTEKFKFIPYQLVPGKPAPRHVYYLLNDRQKGFWVASSHGLFYLDKTKQKYTEYFSPFNDTKLAGFHNAVETMMQDPKDATILWLGGHHTGLLKFNTKTKQIEERFTHDPKDNQSITSNAVWSLHIDKKGNFWVGTSKGFNKFDLQTKTFTRFVHQPTDPLSISGNNIQDIFEDKAGTIWLSTFDGGISSFNPYLNNFIHYSEFEYNSSRVGAFCEDKEGNIWFALGRGKAGLGKLNRKKNTIQLFRPDPKSKANSVGSRVTNALLTDVDGSIWVGTIGAGLDHYDPKTGIFTHYLPDLQGTKTLRSPHIGSLHQDKNKPNIVWVGTRGGGVFKFDKTTKEFKEYRRSTFKDKPNLVHNTVIDIVTDHKNCLWFATRGGLSHFDPATEKFTNYRHSVKNLQSLSNNYVTSLYYDKQHRLWVGTRNGLNKLNLDKVYKGTVTFQHYTTRQGLPNSVIHKIVEDRQGFLWLSTNKGLARLDKKTGKIQVYDEKDGLQANEFATGSGLLASDGAVLMGGFNGFNLFYPEKLNENNYLPNVLLTDFQVFNRSEPVTKNGKLTRPIWATDTIELSYEDEVISFEFAALNYILPEKNKYAIKLENFDKEWRYIGTKHFETYTSLPAGTYVFKVKAANNEGAWSNKETQLVLIIHPPYWATWWFRLIVILLIVGLLMVGYRFRINIIQTQKRILETQVKERTTDLRETNEELQQTNEELQTTLAQVKEKNLIIQEFNENIRESINYAQLIQQDMLPALKEIHYYLPESFIFYQPRDIVSGDFYWFSAIDGKESHPNKANLTTQHDQPPSVANADKIIIAVGDCTGHGVPGAFMSIKGAVLLNQIVQLQGIVCPAEILTELDNNIRHSLNQDETSNRDGMDIGIIMIDFANQTLEFAGAKNSLIYINDGKLNEIKGNILPIGGYHQEYKRDFSKTVLPLEPNTNYYLSSDGYKDQFGGQTGKKFLRSRYKSMLLDICHLPMQEQYKIVERTFLEWKKDYAQVDDILVMGINL